jgi:CheY-like chemotaxis protein
MQECKIMLVEDYPVNRELAKIHLSKLGCTIIEAVNGKKAVELFENNDVDLILMDIQMAEMDGCEATKAIRTKEKGEAIPIIGMTANAFESDIKYYYSIGMNDVITKPFKKKEFIYKVVLWMSKSKKLECLEEDSAVEDLVASAMEMEQHEKWIDIEKNIVELDGDAELFFSIMQEFLENAKNQVPLIEKAAENEEYEVLVRQAHSIKGGALNMISKPLAQAAEILELTGKNKDLTGIKQTIQCLNQTINATQQFLNSKRDRG